MPAGVRRRGRQQARAARARRRIRAATEDVIVPRGHVAPGPHLVAFSHDGDRDTVDGFRLACTCAGKPANEDRDLRTIADGGDDTKALARRSGRVLKGTARVRGETCESVTLTFRASGKVWATRPRGRAS